MVKVSHKVIKNIFTLTYAYTQHNHQPNAVESEIDGSKNADRSKHKK